MVKSRTVIFSDKAYNAIIRESFAKHPVETGGILLGYRPYDELWVVIEVIPPGNNAVHQPAFFQRDVDFVNYLATSISNQYKQPLEVLGLWHRHPGSMDYFSSTDDESNSYFASLSPYGTISGLVNIDPAFRLTMYHLDHNDGVRPKNIAYTTVDVEVGDDLIPDEFFALRYIDEGRSDLHPIPTNTNTQISKTRKIPQTPRNSSEEILTEEIPVENNINNKKLDFYLLKDFIHQKWVLSTIAGLIFIVGILVGVKVIPTIKKWVNSTEISINKTENASTKVNGKNRH